MSRLSFPIGRRRRTCRHPPPGIGSRHMASTATMAMENCSLEWIEHQPIPIYSILCPYYVHIMSILQLVYNANTDASTCLQLFTVYVYSRCGRISTSLCLWLKDKLRRLRRWHCQWSQGSSSSPKYRPSSVVHLTKIYKNSILCSTARLTRHFTWLVILPILQTSWPENSPAGRMNMFATECSKPMAMNIEIGNQTPTILPERSFRAQCRERWAAQLIPEAWKLIWIPNYDSHPTSKCSCATCELN